MKYFALLVFVCAGICSCTKYVDPKEIKVADYEPAVKELIGQLDIIHSISDLEETKTGWVTLDTIIFRKALIARFPKAYELIKTKKVLEFFLSDNNCVFIVLKIHPRNTGSGIECIKTSTLSDCKFGASSKNDIEKEVKLSNGWKYQLIGTYFE